MHLRIALIVVFCLVAVSVSGSAAAPKAKAVKKVAAHPTYKAMVTAAITALKNRNGSSRQAIQKYIEANYKGLNNVTLHLRNALKSMMDKGDITRTKGTGVSGSFKIVKKAAPKKRTLTVEEMRKLKIRKHNKSG